MRLLIILTTLAVAVQGQQVYPSHGKVPLPYNPGPGYYPYQNYYQNHPYQGQYPYYGYPYQYPQGYVPGTVPTIPVKGGVDPIIPAVPVPVIDYVQPSVTLSPLETALAHVDHKKTGHSEKYYYGRSNLGPSSAPNQRPSNSQPPNTKPKADQSFRARHHAQIPDYSGIPAIPYPGVEYTYPQNYQYPYAPYPQQYPYQQYYPQPQVTQPVQQPYPYNTYYPQPALTPVITEGYPISPYNVDVKKPLLVDEVVTAVDGHHNRPSKRPFTVVDKDPHYEVYVYQ